jgi:hypothetical protein
MAAQTRDGRRQQRRREELELAGRGLGLEFASAIPSGALNDVPVPPPMLHSDHRWKSGFVFGTWRSIDIKVFDWWGVAFGSGEYAPHQWPCLCAVTEADASFPKLAVTPRTTWSRLVSFIPPLWQHKPITLPWNSAFDRAFAVRPDNPGRAGQILGDDLMKWLRSIRRWGFGFAMRGPLLMSYCPELSPEQLNDLLDVLLEFRRRVLQRRSG